MYNVYEYNTSFYSEHGVLLTLDLADTVSSSSVLNLNPVIIPLSDTVTESDFLVSFVSLEIVLLDDVSVTQWLDLQLIDSPFYEDPNADTEVGTTPSDAVNTVDWLEITLTNSTFYEVNE